MSPGLIRLRLSMNSALRFLTMVPQQGHSSKEQRTERASLKTCFSLVLRTHTVNSRWIITLYCLPAIVFTGAILPFVLGDLDFEISRNLYNEKAQLWTHSQTFPWPQLYRFGPFPAVLTATIAFSVLVLSFMRSKFASYRKGSLFLVLSLLLGPVLLAGRLLGQILERPQPYETDGLGGTQDFGTISFFDPAAQGYFPDGGLSSMGFYFFSTGFLLLARGRRKAGAAILLAAGLHGCAIGIASVVKGGTFAGDVLLSAAVSWLCSAGIFHLLGLHHKTSPGRNARPDLPGWASFGILTAVLSAAGLVCLAFPSSRITETELLGNNRGRLPDTVYLDLDLRGDLEISGGNRLVLETEFRGLGFPGSHLQTASDPVNDGNRVIQRIGGHFTKLNVRNQITLPPNRVYHITLGGQVVSVAVLPPKPDRTPGFFAHVWLTSGFKTKLQNIKGKAVAEDFFGRRTRSFRVE